jgi:uncharacterized repeat protein (TIGR04076 family)
MLDAGFMVSSMRDDSFEGGYAMADDPGFGTKLMAEVAGLKGSCNAGHKVGDRFEVSCYNAGGLCGYLYTTAFPFLNVMQFGGSYPWGADEMEIPCPDGYNQLTLKVWRVKEKRKPITE